MVLYSNIHDTSRDTPLSHTRPPSRFGITTYRKSMQAVKVLEMFQKDADLPKWQAQVSGRIGRGRGASGCRSTSAPTSGNGRNASSGGGGGGRGAVVGEGGALGGDEDSVFDARGMDFVIDEMALACQVGGVVEWVGGKGTRNRDCCLTF